MVLISSLVHPPPPTHSRSLAPPFPFASRCNPALVFIGSLSGSRACLEASRILHGRLLRCVLQCSTFVFDATPLAALLNRFGTDTQSVDMEMPGALIQCLQTLVYDVPVMGLCSPLQHFGVLLTVPGEGGGRNEERTGVPGRPGKGGGMRVPEAACRPRVHLRGRQQSPAAAPTHTYLCGLVWQLWWSGHRGVQGVAVGQGAVEWHHRNRGGSGNRTSRWQSFSRALLERPLSVGDAVYQDKVAVWGRRWRGRQTEDGVHQGTRVPRQTHSVVQGGGGGAALLLLGKTLFWALMAFGLRTHHPRVPANRVGSLVKSTPKRDQGHIPRLLRGYWRSTPQGMMLDVGPLVKSSPCGFGPSSDPCDVQYKYAPTPRRGFCRDPPDPPNPLRPPT